MVTRPLEIEDGFLVIPDAPGIGVELAEGAAFLFATRPLAMTEQAAGLLDAQARGYLADVSAALAAENDWTIEALEATTKALAERLEYTVAHMGSGTTKASGVIKLELTNSYGQFNKLHMNQDGVIR